MIYDTAKEFMDSLEKGLSELHRIYIYNENFSYTYFIDISMWAAYFGDPGFAMEAMEKGHNINTLGLFRIWYPLMQEVRQISRFKEFVREIGLVDYWNKFGWPDFCHQLDNDDFECD